MILPIALEPIVFNQLSEVKRESLEVYNLGVVNEAFPVTLFTCLFILTIFLLIRDYYTFIHKLHYLCSLQASRRTMHLMQTRNTRISY